MKKKRKNLSVCRGTVNKATFRSSMVKWEVGGEMLERRLQGLLTTGSLGITGSLMRGKS